MTHFAENDAPASASACACACALFEGLRSGPCVVCGLFYDEHLAPRAIPPVLTDLPEPTGNHCPGCGWSSGGHDPRCPIPPDVTPGA